MFGSSSEAAYLRDDQRDTVAEIAAKTAAGSVPVLVGAIDMTTARVVAGPRKASGCVGGGRHCGDVPLLCAGYAPRRDR